MKAYSGFRSEAAGKKTAPLPAGPYVAKILSVKVDGQEPDQTLILRVDVVEGQYAHYFLDRYNNEKKNSKYEPKYKGDYKLRIPNDDNDRAMYPDSDKRKFGDAIYRIESSNPGYHWDWNENGLVGLYVGINMQEGEYNGTPFTRIGRLEIAEDVRRGIVKTMPPREPRGDAYDTPAQPSGFTPVEIDDGQLPF